MIALRGIVRCQNSDDDDDDEQRRRGRQWTWKGVWTFGILPDNPEAALAERHPSCRPFDYVWEETRDANNVLVPSANITQIKSEQEENSVVVLTKEQEDNAERKVKDAAADSLSKEEPAATGTATEKADGNAAAASDANDDTATTKQNVSKREEEAEPMEVDETSDSKKEEGTEHEEKASKDATMSEPTESAAAEKAKTDSGESGENMETGNEEKQQQEKPKKVTEEAKVTFATTTSPDEPPFTDAATKYPEKCPPGGAWKGHFETATNRKGKSTVQIAENFCLFFNATPAKDARVLFLPADKESKEANEETNDDEQTKQDDSALLPAGLIHVRGCGSNHYGNWELIGSFDVDTGVLECQRMYVRQEEKPKTPGRRGRPPKSAGRRASIEAALAANAPRPSRKRQASWRKRASWSDDDDAVTSVRKPSAGPGRGTGRRGRPRKHPIVEPPSSTPEFTSPSGTFVSVPSSGSTKRTPVSTPGVPTKAAVSGQKRKASSQSKSSPPAETSTVKLPHAGDPNDARWRSAHFLYYQRYEASSDDGAGSRSSPSSAADAASFVVYEGEMSQGNCLRDGRGVCLYNNGTLYEGEWKRNKEHGKGTLMTADRRRIIYEGDWERGKIHGRGTYFYTQDDPFASRRRKDDSSDLQLGSRYEGEFRENTRHGTGKYFLPDGSVYNGDWRSDQMSGTGEFRWPDGSVYVGSWRDGKRNGSGVLKASDGFTYDGAWVQNAMEGRGIATYPSGQRYEGMFSQGRREGRGTIRFANGAVYEGRFRDDCMEGGGTMKMTSNALIPRRKDEENGDDEDDDDWMIPIAFHSDMGYIHQKAGFTVEGE